MITAVVGLGRFGYFWAEYLSTITETWAYNRNPARATPPQVRRVTIEELAQADVLFLCVAISSVESVLKSLKPHLKSGALVVDTCSVKVIPVKTMQDVLGRDFRIMASHPMFGPDSAKNGVQGLPMVLYPIQDAEEDYKHWSQLFEKTGLKVLRISPEEHDKVGAYTQGVTHFIGRVLSRLSLEPHSMGTKGYQSLLEIMQQTCNDPFQLFLDLQNYNPYTSQMRDELHSAFLETEKLLHPQGAKAELEASAAELDRPKTQE
jgi:prephenate dehydrogenase